MFLMLQLGICALSLYLSGTRKHRSILKKDTIIPQLKA